MSLNVYQLEDAVRCKGEFIFLGFYLTRAEKYESEKKQRTERCVGVFVQHYPVTPFQREAFFS